MYCWFFNIVVGFKYRVFKEHLENPECVLLVLRVKFFFGGFPVTILLTIYILTQGDMLIQKYKIRHLDVM